MHLIRRMLLLSLLVLPGCREFLAQKLIEAPNLHFPAAQRADASDDDLRRYFVDRQLRVPVGPAGTPDATLSVWISEPTRDVTTFGFEGDAANLRAVISRSPNPKLPDPATQPAWPIGTLVFLHGIQDRKEYGAHLLYREVFNHQGYRVVQVDLRGHGRSTGNTITWGARESHDLVQVLDHLEQQNLLVGRVGVIGFSYGAAVAIQWAAVDPRVRAVVAIEPFTSMYDVTRDGAPFVLGRWRFLFSDADVRTAVDLAGRLAGFDPATIRPIDAITRTTAPVLLFHSRKDELIPYTHSERLHAAARGRSWLVLVGDSSHFDIWHSQFELIRSISTVWLKRKLAPPATAPATAPE